MGITSGIGCKAGETGGANVPTLGRLFVGELDGGDDEFMDEGSIKKESELVSIFYERVAFIYSLTSFC